MQYGSRKAGRLFEREQLLRSFHIGALRREDEYSVDMVLRFIYLPDEVFNFGRRSEARGSRLGMSRKNRTPYFECALGFLVDLRRTGNG